MANAGALVNVAVGSCAAESRLFNEALDSVGGTYGVTSWVVTSTGCPEALQVVEDGKVHQATRLKASKNNIVFCTLALER